ncbi:hypothetical protein GON26_20575 [Flavobacterium sp. GA093]|uniref:Uncharacterized protein n=1 Tax=Flavobacterium hydrocarbonoxydans TaxID=2683249 RepID=A0A6I4P0Y6_9FLAO|nr:hypothetical protein [Flavobacterium hydrocarbonoxydans]MWB96764.1 hypothetical protein [Flavobacterium hydrocarbonoxydans]
MATNLNTILSWFKTGLKPTQAQFWASWQSFWHKDELIPQNNIADLALTLNAKAEKSQLEGHMSDDQAHAALFDQKTDELDFHTHVSNFESHVTDPNAHPELQLTAKMVFPGQFVIFKRGAENLNVLEVEDLVMGIVEGQWITGRYLGGDSDILYNFDIINRLDFSE